MSDTDDAPWCGARSGGRLTRPPGGRGRPDAATAIELRPPPAPRSQALRPDPSRFDTSRPRTHA